MLLLSFKNDLLSVTWLESCVVNSLASGLRALLGVELEFGVALQREVSAQFVDHAR